MYCHIIAFIDRHSDVLLLSGSKDFSLIIKKMGLRQLALQCHLGKCKFTSYFLQLVLVVYGIQNND